MLRRLREIENLKKKKDRKGERKRERKIKQPCFSLKAVATVTSSRFLVSCSAKTTRDKSEKAAFCAVTRLTQLVSVEDAVATVFLRLLERDQVGTQQQQLCNRHNEHVNSFRLKLIYTETLLMHSFVLYTEQYKFCFTTMIGPRI